MSIPPTPYVASAIAVALFAACAQTGKVETPVAATEATGGMGGASTSPPPIIDSWIDSSGEAPFRFLMSADTNSTMGTASAFLGYRAGLNRALIAVSNGGDFGPQAITVHQSAVGSLDANNARPWYSSDTGAHVDIAAGDVNGDGCRDVVVARYGGKSATGAVGGVYIYPGTSESGSCNWHPASAASPIGVVCGGFTRVTLADLNRDGLLDVLATSQGFRSYPNCPDPSADIPIATGCPGIANSCSSPPSSSSGQQSSQFGNLRLPGPGVAMAFINPGNESSWTPLILGNGKPIASAVTDLDGDGWTDIILVGDAITVIPGIKTPTSPNAADATSLPFDFENALFLGAKGPLSDGACAYCNPGAAPKEADRVMGQGVLSARRGDQRGAYVLGTQQLRWLTASRSTGSLVVEHKTLLDFPEGYLASQMTTLQLDEDGSHELVVGFASNPDSLDAATTQALVARGMPHQNYGGPWIYLDEKLNSEGQLVPRALYLGDTDNTGGKGQLMRSVAGTPTPVVLQQADTAVVTTTLAADSSRTGNAVSLPGMPMGVCSLTIDNVTLESGAPGITDFCPSPESTGASTSEATFSLSPDNAEVTFGSATGNVDLKKEIVITHVDQTTPAVFLPTQGPQRSDILLSQ